MNQIMKLGSRRPLTEKDVWQLDSWDKTETLNDSYVNNAYLFFLNSFLFFCLPSFAQQLIIMFCELFRFQKSWAEEIRRPKPWLLRALNRSLGARQSSVLENYMFMRYESFHTIFTLLYCSIVQKLDSAPLHIFLRFWWGGLWKVVNRAWLLLLTFLSFIGLNTFSFVEVLRHNQNWRLFQSFSTCTF